MGLSRLLLLLEHSEWPPKGALHKPLHIDVTPQLINVPFILVLERLMVHDLGDDLLAANWTSVVGLIDPAIEAD